MKKILFTIGIVIVLALLGGWGYLLIYGAPENMQELGAEFRSADPVDVADAPATSSEPASETAVSVNTPLSQISTRLVAGATFLERNGATYIRYVERGTGHIFEVSLTNGSSERITNTTIPRTTDAAWASTGNRVVLTTERSGGNAGEVFIGTLNRNNSGTTVLDTEPLASGAENIAFHDQGSAFYYSVRENGSTAGYLYDLNTGAQERVFTAPFVDIAVLWDTSETENHYVYTDPSHDFEGYLYEVTSTGLRRLAEGAGLTAGKISDTQFFVTRATENGLLSEIHDTTTGSSTALAVAALPSKCDAVSANELWCGAPLQVPAGTYPDEWYQGVRNFNDRIWRVDIAQNEAFLEVNPEEQARTVLDATELSIHEDGDRLFFVDKRTGTLWLASI